LGAVALERVPVHEHRRLGCDFARLVQPHGHRGQGHVAELLEIEVKIGIDGRAVLQVALLIDEKDVVLDFQPFSLLNRVWSIREAPPGRSSPPSRLPRSQEAVDRIIAHLKLVFVAERPPPPQTAFQELLWEVDPPAGFFHDPPAEYVPFILRLGVWRERSQR